MSDSPPSITLLTDPTSIASFNRGPITTGFSPPASCVEELTLAVSAEESVLFFGHNRLPYVDSACYPPGLLQAQYIGNVQSWVQYYYSPGICPQGYTIATTFESNLPGGKPSVNLAIGSETTVALCCPSGYSYLRSGHQCASTISRGQTIKYVLPTSTNGWQRGSVSTSTFPTESSARGDGLPIMWQDSDSALLAVATSTPSTDRSATGITLAGATASSTRTRPVPQGTNPPGSRDQNNGLETGAMIGLGVVIPLVVVSGLLLGLLLLRRKHKNQSPESPRPWKDRMSFWKSKNPYEIHEMPHAPQSPRHELPVNSTPKP